MPELSSLLNDNSADVYSATTLIYLKSSTETPAPEDNFTKISGVCPSVRIITVEIVKPYLASVTLRPAACSLQRIDIENYCCFEMNRMMMKPLHSKSLRLWLKYIETGNLRYNIL